ncbi:MAG TPA: FtsX-like permease family protein [Phycisphaerae bacterium]
MASIALIAVVIGVFAYLQAVVESAVRVLARSADPNAIVILSPGALSETVSNLQKDQINRLETIPQLVRDADGPIISNEIVALSSAVPREGGDVTVNAAVRGVDLARANRVRHGRVHIMPGGRAFRPGASEIIVGAAVHHLHRNHDPGDEVVLGTRASTAFRIVGVFDTGGTAADSEIWGDVERFRETYGRTGYSAARVLVPDGNAAWQAIQMAQGPSVGLSAQTESDYFRRLGTNQRPTFVLSIAIVIILGIAAALAVANTMYASVAARTGEIAMLRTMGFVRSSILAAFVLEGLALAALGGALGVLLSCLWYGTQQKMVSGMLTVVSYRLAITAPIAATCLAVGAGIGLAGTLLPAWRASRVDVVTALREM